MSDHSIRALLHLLAVPVLAMQVNAQVAEAGPDTSLCVNFYTMQGSAVPPGATGQWVWYQGCGAFNDPTSPTTLIWDLCIGNNVAGWTVDDNGTITTDQVVITVYDPNMPVANAGMDQTIVGPQTSAQLSGSPAPIWPATCQWNWVSGNGVVVDPNDPNSIVTGLIVGDNILTWNCENGPCWSSPTVDTVVIQMMMITGVDDVAPIPSAFAWDPVQHRLHYLGTGRISGLLVFDAQGKAMPLDRNSGQGPWHIPMLKPGVYLVRAEVDGRVLSHRFVLVG